MLREHRILSVVRSESVAEMSQYKLTITTNVDQIPDPGPEIEESSDSSTSQSLSSESSSQSLSMSSDSSLSSSSSSQSIVVVAIEAGDTVVAADMLTPLEINLDTLTTPDAETYSMLSNSGVGAVSISNSTLRYGGGIEASPNVGIGYRAELGGASDLGLIRIQHSNAFTQAEAIDAILAHKSTFEGHMKKQNDTAFYEGCYTGIIYRNAFAAAGDLRIWNAFKQWFDITRNASITVARDGPRRCGMQGPKAANGAQHTSYQWAPSCVGSKAARQWAFSVLHMLWDVLHGVGELSTSQRDWAEQAYTWVHKNYVEFWSVSPGGFMAGINSGIESAKTKTKVDWSRIGYYGSQYGVCMVITAMDKKIREFLNLPVAPFMAINNYDPERWYNDWVARTFVDGNGCRLWDCGDNPNINTTDGWGAPGDHRCPGTNHSSRYMYLAQTWLDFGYSADATVISGLAKTFGTKTCLPLNYVTTSGNHAGKSAGVQQIANYIDGNDSNFRAASSGWLNAAKSNNGMEGQTYNGWYLGAVYNDEARRAMVRLHNFMRDTPSLPASDVRNTGTFARHSLSYGRAGLWAAMLDIDRRINA